MVGTSVINIGPSEGALRVWYIPQVPGSPLFVPVRDLYEAQLVAEALVALSTFEFENNIKPDYSDALGVERFEGEWCEVDTEEWKS